MAEKIPQTLPADLRHSLTRLYLALRRNSPVHGVSAAQASALATVFDHGPIRMGELAERESIRMPTATSFVDGLAREGLVVREPDPADRRAVLISVTDHGRREIDDIRSRRDDVLTAALHEMSDESLTVLIAAAPALAELRTRLENYDD